MSFLHPLSCECTKSELDLFTLPVTQTSIERSAVIEYRPIATIRRGGIIEFNIVGSGEDYIDLAETLLYVKLKVVPLGGAALTADESTKVAPERQFLQTLFSQIDIFLNGKLVTDATDTYPYRAFIETALNYGYEAKKSQLTAGLWDPEDGSIALSKPIELMGRIHADIFNQHKLMLNNVDIKIRLVPNKSQFSLHLHPNAEEAFLPQIEILEASLFVKKVRPAPFILSAHANALQTSTAKYSYRNTQIRTHTIAQGSSSCHIDNLTTSAIPTRIILGFVTDQSFNGSYKNSPTLFQHHHLNYLSLHVDGDQIPSKPLQPDFQEGHYLRSYYTLFTATDKAMNDSGNAISRKDYVDKGFVLYAFDITQDSSADKDSHTNLIRQGVVRVEAKFAKALPQAVVLIAYIEKDGLLEIGRDRNILLDN